MLHAGLTGKWMRANLLWADALKQGWRSRPTGAASFLFLLTQVFMIFS
jgi:hypothetical protein